MSDAVILGAGFSRSISDLMPLAEDLAKQLSRPDSEQSEEPDNALLQSGQDLERWLSYLADYQPFLTPAENWRNKGRFSVSANVIQQAVAASESKAMLQPPPAWLTTLVSHFHNTGTDVVTFNYDTLIERAATKALRDAFSRHDKTLSRCAPRFRGQRFRQLAPSHWDNPGEDYPLPLIPSFRLLKLHGSLDTWWAPGDSTGETVTREHQFSWGQYDRRSGDPDHAPAGKEVFITPPTVTKAPYYQNPVIRQIWRDAFEALTQAQRIYIVGYSLPVADTVVANLVSHSLAVRNIQAQVEVVDISPETVKDRLRTLGIGGHRIDCFTISPEADIGLGPWIDRFVGDSQVELLPPDEPQGWRSPVL